jgi:hypothetical protein
MRGLLFFGLFIIYSPFSSANQCKNLFYFDNIEAPQARSLLFKRLEVFRRNNSLGMQQQGEVTFSRWIEIPPFQENIFNYIALTPEGRLYHVVDGVDRQMARLLSGPLQIEQFYIYKKSVLVAVDSNQRLLFFNPQKWMNKPLKGLLQKGFLAWASITSLATVSLYQFLPDSLGTSSIVLMSGAAGVASAINTFLVMLARYDRLNTYPDGFVDSGLQFTWTGEMNRQLESRPQSDWENYAASEHFLPPNIATLPPVLHESLSEAIR